MSRSLVTGLLLAVSLVACTGSGGAPSVAPSVLPSATAGSSHRGSSSPAIESPATSDGTTDPIAEASETGELVGQARGHLIVSRALFELDDVAGATAHGTHPQAELGAALTAAVVATGGDRAALDASLEQAAGAVASAADATALDAAYDSVDTALDRAEEAVAGDASGSPAYVGSVIARLLATAAHEYAEARAEDGTVRELIEYQDGYGFIREARRRYETIAPAVEAAGSSEAAEIVAAFDALESSIPEPIPPDMLGPSEELQEQAALIGRELAETVGAIPVEESDAAAEVAAIEGLLDQILTAYEAGDAESAAELAAEAYIEHYEVFEAQVIEAVPQVNAELEPLLAAELRRRMGEGAPAEEIRMMIDRARELLGEALEALEGS